MANTTFGTNDPLTHKIWSKGTMAFALQNMALLPLMGTTPESIVHTKKDLTVIPGDTITFSADENDTNDPGQGDNGTTEGNEVALRRRNMKVEVHERAQGTRPDGKMTMQRTDIYKTAGFRAFAKRKLGIWAQEAWEKDLVNCAAGLYNENSSGAAIETINESYPTAQRIRYGGQNIGATPALGTTYSTDAALTAGTQANNLFGTLVINAVRAKALSCSPRFRLGKFYQTPRSADGSLDQRNRMAQKLIAQMYTVLAHPYQINSMRSEVGNIGWNQMTAACAARGDKHPVFAAGAVLWNGCVVMEYDRVPMRTGAGGVTLAEGFLLNAGRTETSDACANTRSVCRALFLGAQAISFAWAQMLQWHEDWYDGRIPRVIVDMMYGLKRTIFNAHGTSTPGQDEAIYCIDTEVIPT